MLCFGGRTKDRVGKIALQFHAELLAGPAVSAIACNYILRPDLSCSRGGKRILLLSAPALASSVGTHKIRMRFDDISTDRDSVGRYRLRRLDKRCIAPKLGFACKQLLSCLGVASCRHNGNGVSSFIADLTLVDLQLNWHRAEAALNIRAGLQVLQHVMLYPA